MSDPDTNSFSFGNIHNFLPQALADSSSDGSESPATEDADSYSTPQEHVSPTKHPRLRPNKATPNLSTQHPDKASPPAHTPQDHDNTNDTTQEIHALLIQMGAVQATMRDAIEAMSSLSARALQDSTEHTTHLAANTAALRDTTRALDANSVSTATTRPAATPSKRVANPNDTKPDTDARAAQDGEDDSVRLHRLEASNAVLERENAALKGEIESLRRENRGLRREWRRNVMMQGMRWVGRDMPR